MHSRSSIPSEWPAESSRWETSYHSVEKAQAAFDENEAKRLQKKVKKEGMDLTDFLSSMKQIEKMGPLEGVLKMLPGVNTKDAEAGEDGSQAHEARRGDHPLDDARGAKGSDADQRIAPGANREGSGRSISDVNRLLDQFREMQKMMKKMAQGGGWNVGNAAHAWYVWTER